ncbi:MAG: YceI family protein [Myxococcota bacterium]
MIYALSPRSFAFVVAALVPLFGCEEEAQPLEPESATDPAAEPGAMEPEAEPEAEAEAEPEAEAEAEADDEPPAAIPEEAHGSYEIDPVHSSFIFAGKHFDVSYTYGMFNQVEGTFDLAEEASDSSVKITVDTDSLFTADKKRDDDLKGPDFLHVKQFPEITFESTEVKKTPEGYDVTGDLTLRGETKPVTVTMKHIGSGEVPMDDSYRTGFRGELSVDRHEFGMTAMPPVVGEEIELVASIEGIKE